MSHSNNPTDQYHNSQDKPQMNVQESYQRRRLQQSSAQKAPDEDNGAKERAENWVTLTSDVYFRRRGDAKQNDQ